MLPVIAGAQTRGRTYVRRFDWDEARVRHSEGESIAALAREYGVTKNAVARVVDLRYLEWEREAQARYRAKLRCEKCGTQVGAARTRHADGKRMCVPCRAEEMRTRYRSDGTVWCPRCAAWKLACEFPPAATRPSNQTYCRVCQTAVKREWRARRDPAVAERERQRDQARSRRKETSAA